MAYFSKIRQLFFNTFIGILVLCFTYHSVASRRCIPPNKSVPEAAVRLCEYKESIEAYSYETTLYLCLIYRQAKEPLNTHLSAQIIPTKYQGDGSASAYAQGLKTWGRVILEGLIVFADAIFGEKADYIETYNISLIDDDSWFQSTYTAYLAHSDGFKQATGECLPSVEERKTFQSTVLNTDYVFSVVGQVFMFVVPIGWMGKVFKVWPRLSQGTKQMWDQTVSTWKQIDWRFKVAYGTIGAGPLAAVLYLKHSEQEQKQNALTEVMADTMIQTSLRSLYVRVLRPISNNQTVDLKIIERYQSIARNLNDEDRFQPQSEITKKRQHFYKQMLSKIAPFFQISEGNVVSSRAQSLAFELMSSREWIPVRAADAVVLANWYKSDSLLQSKFIDLKERRTSKTDVLLMSEDLDRLLQIPKQDRTKVQDQYIQNLEDILPLLLDEQGMRPNLHFGIQL